MPTVEDCINLLSERGHSEYGGEAVTQLEHALQCAMLAETENASAELITAALLHDIGHMLHTLANDAPEDGIDDAHENLGGHFLRQIFPESVTEPVRLHVPAKRYLCSTDEKYHRELSRPSIISLKLQGGLMSTEELAEFSQNPFSQDAIRLRHWDDAAKVKNLLTPPLASFAGYLGIAAKQDSDSLKSKGS